MKGGKERDKVQVALGIFLVFLANPNTADFQSLRYLAVKKSKPYLFLCLGNRFSPELFIFFLSARRRKKRKKKESCKKCSQITFTVSTLNGSIEVSVKTNYYDKTLFLQKKKGIWFECQKYTQYKYMKYNSSWYFCIYMSI